MDLQEKLKDLVIVDDPGIIGKTADVLEGMKYTPTLLTDFPGFLRVSSDAFFARVEEILNAPDVDEGDLPPDETQDSFRERQVSMLIYHYKLLNRLRQDEPEAWDEINELMEDD